MRGLELQLDRPAAWTLLQLFDRGSRDGEGGSERELQLDRAATRFEQTVFCADLKGWSVEGVAAKKKKF